MVEGFCGGFFIGVLKNHINASVGYYTKHTNHDEKIALAKVFIGTLRQQGTDA